MKAEKKKHTWLIAAIVILIIAVVGGLIVYHNSHFAVASYTVDSDKTETGFRVVQVSDLHQKNFGQNNINLLQTIGSLQPDVIILSGDIIDSQSTDPAYAVNLCRELVKIAPVVYTYGNHENNYIYGIELNKGYLDELSRDTESLDLKAIEIKKDFREKLESVGTVVLSNDSISMDIRGCLVDIGAVSTNLSSFWDYSGDFTHGFLTTDTDNFKLFVCHRPQVVAEYLQEYNIDLALSGHTHGGVIRLPDGTGLIDTEGGFICKYPGGVYDFENIVMIVSRGFAGSGIIPRINNIPELVVIDVK